MPYSPPSGSAANFLAAGTTAFPRAYNGLGFRFPAGSYSAPSGDNVDAQFPAPVADGYTPPAGDAADFVEAGASPVVGSGAVTVEIVAAGSGEHEGSTVIGIGAATVGIDAAGDGAHGVAGAGAASVSIEVSGAGAHGVAGQGAASVGISAVGSGIVERYEIRGEVSIQGVLVDRLVRAYRRDTGELVGEANTIAGRFRVHCGFAAREHYVVPIHLVNDAEDWAPPCANRVVSVLAQDAV